MAKRGEGASGDSAVGWGKPPVASRFSATNQPKRRGAAFELNRKPAHELECEKVSVRRGGQTVEMPLREVMDRALIKEAFSKVRAARKLYAMLDAEEDAQATQHAPGSARLMKELRELIMKRVRADSDRLAWCAENGLLEQDMMGQWQVPRSVRQAMWGPAAG